MPHVVINGYKSHIPQTIYKHPMDMYAWICMFCINLKMPVAMALVCALLVYV